MPKNEKNADIQYVVNAMDRKQLVSNIGPADFDGDRRGFIVY
jgi:hypothetical protein